MTEFIDIFETSTNSMGLATPAQKAAYQVHRKLDFVDVDPEDWISFKAHFLKKYRGEHSAHVIASFDTFKQKKGECFMQFYARVVNETRLFIDQLIISAANLPAEIVALADCPKAAYDKLYWKQMRHLTAIRSLVQQ